jgi:hypothetical protein
MVPRETTIAVVEAELPSLRLYGERKGWKVQWDPDRLVILADGTHPADKSAARLHADVTGYKAQPPAWRFIAADKDTPEVVRVAKPGPLDCGIGTMFHTNGVICAPFNRLAFRDHGGPHNDWADLTAWQSIRGWVTARRLGEMLAQIALHLKYSPGWQS